MKDQVAYVAGPYRGKTVWETRLNIRMAEAVALELWRMGYACICPHKNTALLDGACPDETWLKGDLVLLARCDFVVLAPGWENSQGTLDEISFAKDHGIPVYESLEDFVNETRKEGVKDENGYKPKRV